MKFILNLCVISHNTIYTNFAESFDCGHLFFFKYLWENAFLLYHIWLYPKNITSIVEVIILYWKRNKGTQCSTFYLQLLKMPKILFISFNNFLNLGHVSKEIVPYLWCSHKWRHQSSWTIFFILHSKTDSLLNRIICSTNCKQL